MTKNAATHTQSHPNAGIVTRVFPVTVKLLLQAASSYLAWLLGMVIAFFYLSTTPQKPITVEVWRYYKNLQSDFATKPTQISPLTFSQRDVLQPELYLTFHVMWKNQQRNLTP